VTMKKEISAKRILHNRSTFANPVTVSVDLSTVGSTELIFIEPGAKNNPVYYRGVLLCYIANLLLLTVP